MTVFHRPSAVGVRTGIFFGSERWQDGDLMLVDNVRTAHGREPFKGPREVVVAVADAVRVTDCSPTIEVTAR